MEERNDFENVSKHQETYVDYTGSIALNRDGFSQLQFTTKAIKFRNNGALAKIVHVEGVNRETGEWANFDLFPVRCQTLADMSAMPEVIGDIKIRIGYLKQVDQTTGEISFKVGKPKLAGWFDGEKWQTFHGEKPTWTTQGSVWSNDESAEVTEVSGADAEEVKAEEVEAA